MPDTESDPNGKANEPVDAGELERWRTIVGEIGAEIASPLTSAMERITALIAGGRIDRDGLRALRELIARARQVGIESQQLARLSSGRLRQSHERVQLSEMLIGVLSHRTRETTARGVEIELQQAGPAEVIVDASLLFGLINAILDWALACARSTIEFRVALKTWPAHAQLACHFLHRPVDELDDGAATPGEVTLLDSLHWRLLQQTAQTMGLPLERVIDASGTRLTLEFPRTVNHTMDGASTVEIDDGFAPSINTKPLAGSHVLVVARRSELRAQAREALRNMGLIVDFVASIEEAVDFCRDGLPHAIVVESDLCDERFNELKRGIMAELPQFVFIEIVEDGRAFEMSGFSDSGMARIGREVIAQSLPSALMFELSRDS